MEQNSADALAAAREMRELIWKHRHDTENGRQLAQPIVEALEETKLGRMALPAADGGLEVPPTEALPIFEALAEAEASVAWIVWNSSLPCWFARFLSEDARKEVFRDSRSLLASSTRPSGRATRKGDAYNVNGRWSLVSGCLHAAWIPVMCLIEQNGEIEMLAPNAPHIRMLFVRRESHEILDTWHVGGLRGTGSHDAVLRDVEVPAELSFAVGDTSLIDSPQGRIPITATMSAGCASICLGLASASLRALTELAQAKRAIGGGPDLREHAFVQSLVARLGTKLDALRGQVRSSLDRPWRKARAGTVHDSADLGTVLAASVTAAQECRSAVTEIHSAAGTASLYTDNPIERAHRDIHAVTQHIVLQPFWLEQAGRVRLGLEPTHPLFAL